MKGLEALLLGLLLLGPTVVSAAPSTSEASEAVNRGKLELVEPRAPHRPRRHADSEDSEEEYVLVVPNLKVELERRIEDLEGRKKLAKKFKKSSKKELKRLKKRLKTLKHLESGEEDGEYKVMVKPPTTEETSVEPEQMVPSEPEESLASALADVMGKIQLLVEETRRRNRCEREGEPLSSPPTDQLAANTQTRIYIETTLADLNIQIKVHNRAENSERTIIVGPIQEELEVEEEEEVESASTVPPSSEDPPVVTESRTGTEESTRINDEKLKNEDPTSIEDAETTTETGTETETEATTEGIEDAGETGVTGATEDTTDKLSNL